jgi:hypothetical protein
VLFLGQAARRQAARQQALPLEPPLRLSCAMVLVVSAARSDACALASGFPAFVHQTIVQRALRSRHLGTRSPQ